MKDAKDRSFWTDPNAVHRRAMYKGAGYSDADIKSKPHIGIANSFMEGSPGTGHLRQLAEAVKQGIWEAGGLPVEFGIPATCGNIANGIEEMKFELAARDVVAGSVEIVTEIHQFDGLVMLSSCDNIIAGTYLAASRLDIPSLIVTGGSMMPGVYKGRKLLACDVDVARFAADASEMDAIETCACPSFGACATMGTACTMQLLGETLNLVLPGSSIVPGNDHEKTRSAREAGRAIVEMVRENRTPSRLITRETLRNAIMVGMASGGSTNIVLHLLAMANEMDIELSLDDFEELGREIPCICRVKPNGPFNVVDLHQEGGALALMKRIEQKLDTTVETPLGGTWKDLLENVPVQVSEVLPEVKEGEGFPGLKVLYGSLAPKGAVLRPSSVPDEMKRFRGPARVFENDADAFNAIEGGNIHPGDVMVVRYEGCKGSPGMKELMLSTDALVARGLHHSVGLVTDARFSGFNHGSIVGHICPEAFDGGPIALVEEGDIIAVDTIDGTIDLEISEEELQRRAAEWKKPEPKIKRGFMSLYAATCRPADEGGAMQL